MWLEHNTLRLTGTVLGTLSGRDEYNTPLNIKPLGSARGYRETDQETRIAFQGGQTQCSSLISHSEVEEEEEEEEEVVTVNNSQTPALIMLLYSKPYWFQTSSIWRHNWSIPLLHRPVHC